MEVPIKVLRFYDAVVGIGYAQNFSLEFYGDGADSPTSAAPGAAALGIGPVT